MKHKIYSGLLVFVSLFSTGDAAAEIVDLVVDSTISNVDLSINNSMFENSALSGSVVIDVQSSTSPFLQAQITDLSLTIDDALSFNLLGVLVTANIAAGEVSIDMISPGSAATVTAGSFTQTGNLLGLDGDVQVTYSTPFATFGGNQTLDLSTLSPEPTDFDNVQISRTNDVLTISGSFSISDSFEVNSQLSIPVVANGFFSASGIVAIPEPTSVVLVVSAFCVTALRRRRS